MNAIASPGARLAWPAAGAAGQGAGGPRARPWRDGTTSVLVVVVGMLLNFLPAAALVVGGVSPGFAALAAGIAVQWLGCAALMVATLAGLRRRWPAESRAAHARDFAVLAAVGVGFQLLCSGLALASTIGLSAQGWDNVIAAWTAVPVAGYLVWEREARDRHAASARRLFDIQQAQLRLRRSVVDGELRAMQARVDPEFFFATLDAIEQAYANDPARAEALFDELVAFLRAVLPHAEQASSQLGRELHVAAVALRIDALVYGRPQPLTLKVPDELRAAPFPAGVLLPLLRGALAAARAAPPPAPAGFGLSASVEEAATLRLALALPAPPPDAVCCSVESALRALHGDAAGLHRATGMAPRGAVLLHVEVPHDA